MDILTLRTETAADHLAVESAVSLMHQHLNAAEYVQCLRQMYGVVAAWEQDAAGFAPEWLQATLKERSRTALLEQDLKWFGVAKPLGPRPQLPPLNTLPNLFGAMYVMEGSTLGGQLIARHVQKTLDLPDGCGNRFFRGHGEQTGPMWKEFCQLLKLKIPEEQTSSVVASAKSMFQTFGDWMHRNPALIDR